MGRSIVFLGDQFPMPSQQGLGSDNAGDLGQNLSSQRFGLYGQSPALMVIEAHSPVTELFSKRPILLAKVVNDLQLAVVHPPETAISINRNGSIPLCVFKTHYRNRGAAVPSHRIFMQIQFSGHTGSPISFA